MIRYLKHILYNVGIWGVILLLAASCIKEDVFEKVDFPADDEVRIELFTNAQTYQPPMTRIGTANEYGVDPTSWVLVFRGTDEQAVFIEAEQVFVEDGRSYVILKKNDNACRLLIIANPPTELSETSGFSLLPFNKTMLESLLENETFEFTVGYFCTTQLSTPQGTVPYAGESDPRPLIPMSAVVNVSGINNQTRIGTPDDKVSLKRIVAKVTVESNISNSYLLGASVLNVSRSGTFYRDNSTPVTSIGGFTDYFATGLFGDNLSGIAHTFVDGSLTNSTLANPIYIYESAANDATSVIIVLYYNGFHYYRLAFNDETGNIPVERNKNYKFVINSVDGPGYATVEEARAAPPSNIHYTLTITDNTSFDIINYGEYYLGVTNSELWVYSNNVAVSSIVAFQITTNATAAMVENINSITASVAGGGTELTVNTSQATLPATEGEAIVTSVYVSLNNTFTTLSEGTITIELGRIKKEITVRRMPPVPTQANVVSFGSEFFRGEIASRNPSSGASWVILSDRPDTNTGYQGDIVINENGTGIFAHFTTRGATSRTAEVFLSRNTDTKKGRVKAYMIQ